MEITKHIIEKHGLNLEEFKGIQKLLKSRFNANSKIAMEIMKIEIN